MQVPIVLEYKLDIDGNLPDNYVHQEVITRVVGKLNRVVVPEHPPFYIDSVVITNITGEILTFDKDYRFFNMMPDLTAYVGKPVGCLIEILDPDLDKIFINYQVVGHTPVIDQSILALIVSLINDTRQIDWGDITGRPEYFPPEVHSHSLRFDYYVFSDLVKLIDYCIENFLGKEGLGDTILESESNCFEHYLNLYKYQTMDYLTAHVKGHNAHGLTKDQINLGNVDNVRTANIFESRGNRNDLRITPKELNARIRDIGGINENKFVKAGVLPIVSYGNGGVTTPVIGGGPQFSVYFTTDENVIVAGRSLTVPKGTIDLIDVNPNPTNKTFHIYLIYIGGSAQYQISENIFAESGYRANIGSVITDSSNITKISNEKVFSLNGFRVSTIKRGSSIPASTGSILTDGSFPWFTSEDVLTD